MQVINGLTEKLKSLSINPDVEKFIQVIGQRIIEQIKPIKIILFGSYAYGNPQKHSDIDLLVVVSDSKLPRTERAGLLYTELKHFSDYPKDIVIYTLEEVEKWQNVRQAFVTSIINKGVVLYERQV